MDINKKLLEALKSATEGSTILAAGGPSGGSCPAGFEEAIDAIIPNAWILQMASEKTVKTQDDFKNLDMESVMLGFYAGRIATGMDVAKNIDRPVHQSVSACTAISAPRGMRLALVLERVARQNYKENYGDEALRKFSEKFREEGFGYLPRLPTEEEDKE